MEGIFYENAERSMQEVVTLTTRLTEQCMAYHDRMPLIIDERCAEDWLCSWEHAQALALLPVSVELLIRVAE